MPRKRKTPVLPASSVPTGMPYGQHQAMEKVQTQLAGQASAPPASGPSTPPAGIAAAFAAMPFPQGKLNDPTQRPDEQITQGLGSTPSWMPPPPVDNATSLITQMASAPDASPALAELANYMQSGKA